MKSFVCKDKTGTPLYVGDEVICLANGGASVGVVHGGDEHNTRLFKVEFPFPEAGFRSFYQHELEKINIMELERIHEKVKKESKMIDRKLVDYITSTVTTSATNAKRGARLGGHRDYDGGGAAESERQLTFWLLGLEQIVPSQYESIVVEYEKQLKEKDPEYQTYLKLKEKFE